MDGGVSVCVWVGGGVCGCVGVCGGVYVCIYVCVSGYAFRYASRYGAEIWQGDRGRTPEAQEHIF